MTSTRVALSRTRRGGEHPRAGRRNGGQDTRRAGRRIRARQISSGGKNPWTTRATSRTPLHVLVVPRLPLRAAAAAAAALPRTRPHARAFHARPRRALPHPRRPPRVSRLRDMPTSRALARALALALFHVVALVTVVAAQPATPCEEGGARRVASRRPSRRPPPLDRSPAPLSPRARGLAVTTTTRAVRPAPPFFSYFVPNLFFHCRRDTQGPRAYGKNTSTPRPTPRRSPPTRPAAAPPRGTSPRRITPRTSRSATTGSG